MKAVILAGGKGTRMGNLTKDIPKPLLKIGDKTLLEYKLDILPDNCTEVIMIIGYLGEKIQKYFGKEYKGKKITYVHTEPLGTGHALWQAREHLDGPFIVMCGDDLYVRKDIEECCKYPFAALVYIATEPHSGGKVIIKEGVIDDIIEGYHEAGIVTATGLYVLTPEIFDLELLKIPGRDEYGLPQTLMQMKEKKIRPVYATAWHQVTSAEDLQLSEPEVFMK